MLSKTIAKWSFQLCSTFFGICLNNSLNFIRKGLGRCFRPHHRLFEFERMLRIIFPATIFFSFSWQYLDEFFNHNLMSEPSLEWTDKTPGIGLSICFDLKMLPKFSKEFDEKKRSQSDLNVDLNTKQPINRLFNLRLLFDCLVSGVDNQTLWYFRSGHLCLKKVIKPMSDLDQAMPENSTTSLLTKTLHKTGIDFECLPSKCFFVFIHSANDLIRSESQRTRAFVIFNQIFIKKQFPKTEGCVDYSKKGFISQGHCYENCVINSYVKKHDHIPSFVSFDPTSLEFHAMNFSFSDKFDFKIDSDCKRSCKDFDCDLIQFRPVSYKFWTLPSIFIPRQSFLISAEEAYTTTWVELMLKIISLVSFCLGFSLSFQLFQLVHLSSRRQFVFLLNCFFLISFFVLTSLISDNIFKSPQSISTSITKVTTGRPPSLFICRHESMKYLLDISWIVGTSSTVTLYYNLTHFEIFNRNADKFLLEKINFKLKRTPSHSCLQLTYNNQFKFPHKTVIFTLRFQKHDLMLSVDHPNVFLPSFFLSTPFVVTYIHIQTIRSDSCQHYPMSKHSMWTQLMVEEFMRPANESFDLDRSEKLKKIWDSFQAKHSQPECVLDQYLPLIETQVFNRQTETYIVQLANHRIQIRYESSFALSGFVILMLGMMEIFLNVTFNRGMLNLLIWLTHFLKRL